MKLTEKLKETTEKGKELVKKHAVKLEVAGAILVLGGTAYVAYKTHRDLNLRNAELEAQGKKILGAFAGTTTIEGTGPIWDKLKELFSTIDMEPHEIWMVEANEAGKKLIARIPNSHIMEQLEI